MDEIVEWSVSQLHAEPCSMGPERYAARFGHRHSFGEVFTRIAEGHPDAEVRTWAEDVLSLLGSSETADLRRTLGWRDRFRVWREKRSIGDDLP